MKIIETSKWHCVGEIIDKNPPVKVIDPKFFDNVRAIYAEIQSKRDAIIAKKSAERKERLKALRKQA